MTGRQAGVEKHLEVLALRSPVNKTRRSAAKKASCPAILEGRRVLDLTDESGVFCTKALAGLGADVVRIEPPGGDPMRRRAPFYGGQPDPEKSLYWFNFNFNKRSITLDITAKRGQDILRRLAGQADFLVECFPPGRLDELGLGYTDLSAHNPRLIVTSITPYGQSGPHSQFRATDITLCAMGGLAYVIGDDDTPPAWTNSEVAYHQAGAQAAVGTMMAHYFRELTGQGQQVDVSAQECVMVAMKPVDLDFNVDGKVPIRRWYTSVFPGAPYLPPIFRCKDGWVVGAPSYWPGRDRVRDWLNDEGLGEELFEPSWEGFLLRGEEGTPEQQARLNELYAAMCAKHTVAELVEPGQARGCHIGPVNSARDQIADPHLAERGFFREVQHPELGKSLLYPGAPFQLGETPWRMDRRAPLPGEHNEEIYREELGLSVKELESLKKQGVI
jgi:crotonobetainyl-CoA:carnitine CoA-transferase CaiB-like acyl-CoA transferase